MSFHQIDIFTKSIQKFYQNNNNVIIPPSEQHWLKWLQCEKQQNVSTLLHQKYITIHKILTQRRIERIEKAKTLIYNGINYGNMCVADLRETAA